MIKLMREQIPQPKLGFIRPHPRALPGSQISDFLRALYKLFHQNLCFPAKNTVKHLIFSDFSCFFVQKITCKVLKRAELSRLFFSIMSLAVFLIVLLFGGRAPVFAAGSQAMITQFSGTAFMVNSGRNRVELLPFMKLHDGDQITLQKGAKLQLIYFSDGRKELWQGPAGFVVGDNSVHRGVSDSSTTANSKLHRSDEIVDSSRMQMAGAETLRDIHAKKNNFSRREEVHQDSDAFVVEVKEGASSQSYGCKKVEQLPAVVSLELQRISKIIDPSRLQMAGVETVRGGWAEKNGEPEDLTSLELEPAEKRELALARSMYDELIKKLPADDVTAELFLFSVLSDYGQFSEMDKLLEIMRKKQPDNANIVLLAKWLKRSQ